MLLDMFYICLTTKFVGKKVKKDVKFYLYQLSEIYVRLFTLLYTFQYHFQSLRSQKVDKIRPPDQHVSDQQHEKENCKRRNFKLRPGNPLTKKNSLNAPKLN